MHHRSYSSNLLHILPSFPNSKTQDSSRQHLINTPGEYDPTFRTPHIPSTTHPTGPLPTFSNFTMCVYFYDCCANKDTVDPCLRPIADQSRLTEKNVCNLASAPGYQWKGNLRGDKKLNWGHCGTRTRGVIIPERDTPKISKQFCPYCTERRPKLKAASTRAKNEEPRRQSKMEMRERAATPGRAVTPGQGRAPAKAKAPAEKKAPAMAKASKRDATLARDPTPGPATTPAQPSTPVRASPAPEASPPQWATPPAWARNSESAK
jgi:hypothetical protein